MPGAFIAGPPCLSGPIPPYGQKTNGGGGGVAQEVLSPRTQFFQVFLVITVRQVAFLGVAKGVANVADVAGIKCCQCCQKEKRFSIKIEFIEFSVANVARNFLLATPFGNTSNPTGARLKA